MFLSEMSHYVLDVSWETEREDSGYHSWERRHFTDIIEQAESVLRGECTYPAIPIESNPKIELVLFVDDEGKEHNYTEKAEGKIREVNDGNLRTGG